MSKRILQTGPHTEEVAHTIAQQIQAYSYIEPVEFELSINVCNLSNKPFDEFYIQLETDEEKLEMLVEWMGRWSKWQETLVMNPEIQDGEASDLLVCDSAESMQNAANLLGGYANVIGANVRIIFPVVRDGYPGVLLIASDEESLVDFKVGFSELMTTSCELPN